MSASAERPASRETRRHDRARRRRAAQQRLRALSEDNKARRSAARSRTATAARTRRRHDRGDAQRQWDQFFSDPFLQALIREALDNNQELNIRLQEIIIAQNEIAARKGEYLPRLDAGVGVGVEKVGQRTSQGASDMADGVPEHLPYFGFGLSAAWEIDIWKKLRNAAKSADYRYRATIEARNFIITQIVAEIAEAYYELLALDNQIEVLDRNIGIQQDALEIVKLKKEAARDRASACSGSRPR
ncbi:MAG: TolC family protein [Myxococcales bacterium]|nr:TolC family protein [Myxococcales bacterium]